VTRATTEATLYALAQLPRKRDVHSLLPPAGHDQRVTDETHVSPKKSNLYSNTIEAYALNR
jgi:hypothetical protein